MNKIEHGTAVRGSSERAAARLNAREIVFGCAMAATSGLAIIAHVFGPVPLSFTVPFVVMPTSFILVVIMLARRSQYQRLHLYAALLISGALWGLIATLFYDAIRPGLKFIFGFTFNPYRAMPIFGQLITGLTADHPLALLAGWIYHFWNGISFGMIYALVRPNGGILSGLIWALLLQVLMMAIYPAFLKIRLADPGFLAAGIVGHGLWGVVLGAGLRRWRLDA